ncbi:MAG: FecR domain-containing protein [Deltaproteobacteria bacterium]|nr:FecR domain-containing protein [Deltaproteobacteria bacterium]
MMELKPLLPSYLFIALSLILFTAAPVMAAGISVKRVSGLCEYLRKPGSKWLPIARDTHLSEGDRVRTGRHGALTLTFSNGDLMELYGQTLVTLHEDNVPGSKSSIKGLVEIEKGRLRMVIRKLLDKVRTRATSLTAVTGVRGTEFFLDAEKSKTIIGVYDGTVIVANIDIPQQRVEVEKGMKTIVYAGMPPLPPTPLSFGDSNEGGGGDSALDRIEDTVIESTSQLPLDPFMAFPDLHIDAALNPAYAAPVTKRRMQLFSRFGVSDLKHTETPDGFVIDGATVTSVSRHTDVSSRGATTWLSGFQPIDAGFVLGAFGRFQYGSLSDEKRFTGTATIPGSSLSFDQQGREDSPDVRARFQSADAGILAARPMPVFDIGILIRRHESFAKSDNLYSLLMPGEPETSNRFTSKAHSSLNEAVIGIHKTMTFKMEWGWSVGLNKSRSDIHDTSHFMDDAPSPLQRNRELFTGVNTELRVRRRISERWHWGASLRIIHLKGDGHITDENGDVFLESVRDTLYRLGTGVGFTPGPGTAIGFDLISGLRKEKADLIYPSKNPGEHETESNPSIAVHMGGQHWFTDSIFGFADATLLWRRLQIDIVNYEDTAAASPTVTKHQRETEDLSEMMLGCGYRFTKNSWLEYMVVAPFATGRGLRHDLLLRWRI